MWGGGREREGELVGSLGVGMARGGSSSSSPRPPPPGSTAVGVRARSPGSSPPKELFPGTLPIQDTPPARNVRSSGPRSPTMKGSAGAASPRTPAAAAATAPGAGTTRGTRTPRAVRTPGSGRTPSGARTPGAGVELDAEVVCDVSLQEGSEVEAGMRVEKGWRVRNSGRATWLAGTCVEFLGGDFFGTESEPREVDVGPEGLPPGGEVEVRVGLSMPHKTGKYVAQYRLRSGHGLRFGPRLWVLLEVESPGLGRGGRGGAMVDEETGRPVIRVKTPSPVKKPRGGRAASATPPTQRRPGGITATGSDAQISPPLAASPRTATRAGARRSPPPAASPRSSARVGTATSARKVSPPARRPWSPPGRGQGQARGRPQKQNKRRSTSPSRSSSPNTASQSKRSPVPPSWEAQESREAGFTSPTRSESPGTSPRARRPPAPDDVAMRSPLEYAIELTGQSSKGQEPAHLDPQDEYPGYTSPTTSPSPTNSPKVRKHPTPGSGSLVTPPSYAAQMSGPRQAQTRPGSAWLDRDARERQEKDARVQERISADMAWQAAEVRRRDEMARQLADETRTRESLERQARSAAVRMFEGAEDGQPARTWAGSPRQSHNEALRREAASAMSRSGAAEEQLRMEVDSLRKELQAEREAAKRLRSELQHMQVASTPQAASYGPRSFGSYRPKTTHETSSISPDGVPARYTAYNEPLEGAVVQMVEPITAQPEMSSSMQRTPMPPVQTPTPSTNFETAEHPRSRPRTPPAAMGSPRQEFTTEAKQAPVARDEEEFMDLTSDGIDFDARIQRLRSVYARIDEKGTGYLGKKQLYDHIRRSPQLIELFEFSPKPSDGELNILFGKLDADGSNTIDFNEFCEEFLELEEETFWRVMGDRDEPLKGGLMSPFGLLGRGRR